MTLIDFAIDFVDLRMTVNYLTALLINICINYCRQETFSLSINFPSRRFIWARKQLLSRLQCSNRPLDEAEIRYSDNLSCSIIPNGRYWLNMDTGIWGYEGNGAQGHISDNCTYCPGLSERGMLYSPGELLR